MHGRGRGTQHAATKGLKEAAAAEKKGSDRTRARKAVNGIISALGVRTTRAAAIYAIIDEGMTPREMLGIAAAAVYAATGADDPAKAKRHIQVLKSLELLARLVAADQDVTPRDLRLNITVLGGGSPDAAGSGPAGSGPPPDEEPDEEPADSETTDQGEG